MDFTKNSCRLCLKLTSREDMTPLFDNHGNGENVACEWRRMFSFIYDIQGLPDKICNNCKAQAEWILNFHKQCYDNDAILRFNRMNIVQLEVAEIDNINSMSNTYDASDQFHGTQVYENDKDFEKYEEGQIQQIFMEEEDLEIFEAVNNSNEQENFVEETNIFFQGEDEKTCEDKDQLNYKDLKIDYSNEDVSNKELDNYDGSAISGGSIINKSCYNCPICGKSFSQSYNMNVHRKKHENPKPFECTIPGCDRKFSGRIMRDDHIKTIHEKYVYKCPACNFKQKYRVDVVRHIRKAHKGTYLKPVEFKS